MPPNAMAAQEMELGKNKETMESPEAILEKKIKKTKG